MAEKSLPQTKFYLLKLDANVGNCALFWRPDGQGYTCDLDQAGLYDEADAAAGHSVAVPTNTTNRLATRHVRYEALTAKLLHDAEKRP